MKERAELSDTPGRDEAIEDKDNERPRNENAEEGDTEDSLRMQLWTNNLIMREIMSHLDWRDLLRCELVCRLWSDAVKSLQRSSSLRSYDFAMVRDKFWSRMVHYKVKLEVSDLPMQTRPMCAIGFSTPSVERLSGRCEDISPALCDPPCVYKHDLIEAVRANLVSKRSCLLAVGVSPLLYKLLPASYSVQRFLVGLYLPKMSNVNHRMVQYRSEDTVREDVYSVVDDICTTDIIKGVVVFVQHKCLDIDYEYLEFLNYIKNKQPSIPYALGGCVTWEVECNMMKGNMPTMAVFSVPKEPEPVPGPSCQFNMHSLIIDGTVRDRVAIQQVIQTFAGNVSELEYSAALMMSCNEREQSYTVDLELFRASFPHTTLVGGSSDRLIGYNYPDMYPRPTEGTERLSQVEQEFMHDNSTVFIYFSWGKQRTSGSEQAQHSKQ